MAGFRGRKVGKFYVLREAIGRSWVCICPCGREVKIPQTELFKAKCTHNAARKRHPVYMIWRGMKSRCYTPSDTSYGRYGAKGIRVDPEWHEFDIFFRDIGHLWRPGLSLDRIDGDRNYGPGNCRWATIQEQNNNRAVNYRVEIDGQTLTLQQAVDHFGVVAYKTAHARVKRYNWEPLKAASTPAR